MADFQRKTIPFLNRGMNWNAQPDKIPEGQLPWCKNVRVLQQGTIFSAHGHTQAFDGLTDKQYIHSISRLNILNPEFDILAVNPNGSARPNLSATYVVGADQQLFVFQDNDTLFSFVTNPVLTPPPAGQPSLPGQQFTEFSGNPLSIVDAQPVGAAAAWKYIADSQLMVTVGYYPTDLYAQTMARCLTMGLTPPVNTAYVQPIAGGLLFGQYQWMFAYRRVPTGARSNPSAATRSGPGTVFSKIAITLTDEEVQFYLPVAPIDPQTAQPDENVVVDVYRFGGTIFRWALVGSAAGGTLFTDNVQDLQVLAAPSPPQVTDPSTGLTRFNLFRPFVTQDIDQTGGAIVNQQQNGTWRLTIDPAVTGANFNPNWLAGSSIYLAQAAYTIYQVISETELELTEDASGTLTSGTAYTWNTNAGTLMAGQPLPHLWGPYGVGQSASYLFACGDPNSPGTLYWTNGNDPDSTDIVNNIIVGSPSEKLQTGCIYDGLPFTWSTERQFQIYPSVTTFGQFTVQEVAGAKGCWLEWSLSVQSNGFTDQSVTWRGKDGLYDWSTGQGLRRLSDDLYPFFPHDGEPGFAPETIMPFIGAKSAKPEHVGTPDDSQPQYHRTCWFHGMLFYDFVAKTTPPGSGQAVNTFSCLVWDDINCKGWVSLDQPFPDTSHPVARGVEIGANNLKVSWGSFIYNYYGDNRDFETRVITRAEDMGDPRATKLFGDYWLDCTPLTTITVVPLSNYNRSFLTPNIVPVVGIVRETFPLDFNDFIASRGQGFLAQTLGLDIYWFGPDGPFSASLNQWQPSYILKPETIVFRISDRTDEGVVGAKYLMGMNLEANTFDSPFLLDILVDGATIATLTVDHHGQSELPYAWTPVAGYEFQVEMHFPQTVAWELFKINWIFEAWPDAVARTYPFQNLGSSGAKYIRGVVLPMETGGQPGTVSLWGDDDNTTRTFANHSTPNLKKSGIVLDLAAPFVAHEIQFSSLTPIRIWPGEAKIDFDPWPEFSTDVSSFTNLGYEGAKFMQGAVIPMETGGHSVQITVNSDCGTSVTLPASQTPALCKNDFAFSFSPCNNPPSNPFVAHQVQIVPDGDVRIWYNEIRWIWEPMPELAYTWQTQETDHDLPGWHSLRDCYIAYMGGSGAPVLTITTEYGSVQYPLDPVAPGQFTRCYRVLQAQKAKWRSYRVEGCGGFRLFIKDTEVHAKAWGDTGPFKSFQPFGDVSRANGGARI